MYTVLPNRCWVGIIPAVRLRYLAEQMAGKSQRDIRISFQSRRNAESQAPRGVGVQSRFGREGVISQVKAIPAATVARSPAATIPVVATALLDVATYISM